MKSIKNVLLACMVAGGCLASSVVHADGDWKGMREKREKKVQKIYAQLNLTGEQRAKLEANKARHREEKEGGFKEMRADREALRQELMKPTLDMPKINGLQAKINAFQAQAADNRLKHILEVREILTPEQFAQFHAIMEEHKRGPKEKSLKDGMKKEEKE